MENRIPSEKDQVGNHPEIPSWTLWASAAAIGLVAAEKILWAGGLPLIVLPLAVIFLFATVFAAVHFAEVVAQKIGQPFGSVLLVFCLS